MILSMLGRILVAASRFRREPERAALEQFGQELRTLDRTKPGQPATSW
jgi:hypothetical protein